MKSGPSAPYQLTLARVTVRPCASTTRVPAVCSQSSGVTAVGSAAGVVGSGVAVGVSTGVGGVVAPTAGVAAALGAAVMMNGGVSVGVRDGAGPVRGSGVLAGRAVAAGCAAAAGVATGVVAVGVASRGDADGTEGPLYGPQPARDTSATRAARTRRARPRRAVVALTFGGIFLARCLEQGHIVRLRQV